MMRRAWILGLVFLVAAGCRRSGAPPSPAEIRRPVRSIPLAATSPSGVVRFTGTAEPYRRERIGFEVGGRLEFALEAGVDVQGPRLGPGGEVLAPGDVLAAIDPSRLEAAMKLAMAERETAAARVAEARIEVEAILSAELAQAEARSRETRADAAAEAAGLPGLESRARTLDALLAQEEASGASTVEAVELRRAGARAARTELARTRAEFERRTRLATASAAEADRVRGAIEVKSAALAALEARVAELDVAVRMAQRDRSDAVLRAPFSGRVTEVHCGRGVYVSPGRPVVTLTLVDPIQVRLDLSADEERRVHLGDAGAVVPGDAEDDARPIDAHVSEKSQVADPSRGTYQVVLLARNARTDRETSAARVLPELGEVLPVLGARASVPAPLFVHLDCLLQEGETTSVLRLPRPDDSGRRPEAMVPEKVPVEIAPGRLSILQWSFREIAGGSGLVEGDLLVCRPRLEQQTALAWARRDWRLRPGEIVHVRVRSEDLPRGFYVPVEAISVEGDSPAVFVVRDSVARRVPVSVGVSSGETRRIEGAGLVEGDRLVVVGLHDLADGDPVEEAPGGSP